MTAPFYEEAKTALLRLNSVKSHGDVLKALKVFGADSLREMNPVYLETFAEYCNALTEGNAMLCWNIWDGTGGFLNDTIVEVVTVNGGRMTLPAGLVDWSFAGSQTDIAFYRVVKQAPATNKVTAPDILYNAAKIMAERGKQYDKPEGERSMGAAVAAFNIIAGRDLQESEGWLLLQTLKDVRDRQRKQAHVDSLEDCVAYAALKAEARMDGK